MCIRDSTDTTQLSDTSNNKRNDKNNGTVTIGSQVWMTKNLSVDKFRNGDPIPQAKSEEEWKVAIENKQPAWCYYDNNPANGVKWGKLYNWYAVHDSRGLAPKGYHIPTDSEWTTIIKQGKGFLGPKGGLISANIYGEGDFFFSNDNYIGYWWSATGFETDKAWYRNLYNKSSNFDRGYCFKANGLSVRCLRD